MKRIDFPSLGDNLAYLNVMQREGEVQSVSCISCEKKRKKATEKRDE